MVLENLLCAERNLLPLVLDMHYYGYDGNYIEKYIRCEYVTDLGLGVHEYRDQDYADGVLVQLYIENTKCLD